MLDHRVTDQISTRRLRIVKYRGSSHGTNEYPFLIDASGISVVPITSLGLTHTAATDRISSGVPILDEMLGGQGFYRGSSVLVTGTAGTGKSSFAARFVESACQRGERALYLAFEESPSQIQRNMSSVGVELGKWMKKGMLEIVAERPTSMGLESHLTSIYKHVEDNNPLVIAMDPITNLVTIGATGSVKAMLTRLIDYLKLRTITAMFTNLSYAGLSDETSVGISSLMDTWIVLRDVQGERDRRRSLSVLKSRGMAHSSRTREFVLDSSGINAAPQTL
jgi:circadian clock protein KaiC